jgi:hypothetical protein
MSFINYITNSKINFRVIVSIFAVVFLIMLGPFEPGGESWPYWVFADELYSQGTFVIQSRSPLYILYLQLFNWAEFPFSVVMENVVTYSITGFSLYLLLRVMLDEWSSIFATVFWLPFICYSEPPVQALAFSVTSIAFVIRSNSNKFNSNKTVATVSYTLLIMAFMFRQTYILPLVLVVLYDLWSCYKSKGFKNIFLNIIPTFKDWHLIIVITFLIISSMLISEHPWNNAFFSTITWKTGVAQISVTDGAFIQLMNEQYIESVYGNFTDQDFYFTNMELFGGATSLKSAFFNNYEFVIVQWWRNILELFEMTSNINLITNLISLVPWIGHFIGTLLILYGVKKFVDIKSQMFILYIATILLLGSTAIGFPKMRYMIPAVPFLIFSSYWYASVISNVAFPKIFATKASLVKSLLLFLILLTFVLAILLYSGKMIFLDNYISLHPKYPTTYDGLIAAITIVYLFLFAALLSQLSALTADKFRETARKYIAYAIIPVIFLSFTPATTSWINIAKGAAITTKIIKNDSFSFMSSKDQILNLAANCNGIMTLEHSIFAILFSDLNTKIYDIWEIPPFGDIDDSEYNDLNINRVDCLFISNNLSDGFSRASNHHIRYKNYIKHYEIELLSSGASMHKINGYGRAVIRKKR